MARTVGIIGSGHVGATLANNLLVTGSVDKLVLIDTNELKVNSDATDFEDALANLPTHTKVVKNNYRELKHADVVVIAVGSIGVQNDDAKHDRFVELKVTSKAAKEVGTKLREVGFDGVLVSISNPCDVVAALFQHYTGLPRDQVIGTGTLLDTSRMKKVVGQRFELDPRSVSGYNLGEHGNSQFTAWSTVRVLDQPITELAKQKGLDLDKLDQEAKMGGWTVFKGKKYTSYGVATAAVRLVNTILSDARTEMPVSNYRKEYDCYLSYPAVVGRDGIVEQAQLDLTDEELKKLQTSADFIKEKYQESLAANKQA
ncbi:MAG: L-lactate dehydrogenase [Limosilactobacillus fermentum]